jgi:hypothetical protein
VIKKISAIVSGFVILLFLSMPLEAEPLSARDHTSPLQALLLASGLQPLQLAQVSFSPLVVGDEIVGMVAVYDDATTERPADCLELYNNAGQLVAISWFDKFGIQRMAVDRGLLEDNGKLEGVFVLVLDGDSI